MQRLTLKIILSAIALALITIPLWCQKANAQEWIPVKGGIEFGISGMSLVTESEEARSFLIVHDNKGDAKQGRLGLIKLTIGQSPQYFPISWTNSNLPKDLESLTNVPNSNTFMAATSAGDITHFQLDAAQQKIQLIHTFKLPQTSHQDNFEAFALYLLDNRLLAVWAHRGENKDPALLHWGWLDITTYQITPLGSIPITVPFPQGNVRHISDLKIDPAGVIYFTAATDNGNDGPFTSAVYVGGYFEKQEDQVNFRLNQALFPIYRLNNHKVEGLELIPGTNGGIILGTDDENFGSFLWEFGI